VQVANQTSWIELNMKTVPQLEQEETENRVGALIQPFS